jgi:hypothetical protein
MISLGKQVGTVEGWSILIHTSKHSQSLKNKYVLSLHRIVGCHYRGCCEYNYYEQQQDHSSGKQYQSSITPRRSHT